MTSVFAKQASKNWKYRFAGTLHCRDLYGGVPSDPKVAEGWLKSKLSTTDDQIRAMVAETMLERGVDVEEATEIVSNLKHLNGFKRDTGRGLYIEGRQLKAAIKEAASVALAADLLTKRGWGTTNKGLLGFLAEHVMVVEDRLFLGKTEPDGVAQNFVHTFRGSGIQLVEFVEDVDIEFTVESDWAISEDDWATIWVSGERQGLGAARSQGHGRYDVTRWDPIPEKAKRSRA